ncbi:MAG: hypothetical protein H6747_11035 [Deltaproteobacteria bacterium]|nr:hypothetical protein [Deltaproteobacteria bacterium]
MMRIPKLIVALAAVAALGACSSDDGSGGKTTTTDTAGGSDTTGGSDSTGGSDGTGGDTTGVDSVGGDTTGGDTTGGDTTGGDTTVEDTGPAKKYNSCPELGDCVLAACAPKGFADGCSTQCIEDSAQPAINKGLPLLSCVQKTCLPKCKDSTDPGCLNSCMSEECVADLVPCITDIPEPKGDKTCMEAGSCFDSCEGKPNTFACLSGCVATTDKAGVEALSAMAKCMATAIKDGKDPEEACAQEFIGCVVSGKSGDAKCIDFFSCHSECAAKSEGSDDACFAECLPKLTKEAQGQLIAAAPCFEGGGDDPKCGEKMLACIDPSGTETCLSTFGCVEACNAKAGENGDPGACIFGCIGKTSKEEAPLVLGVMKACDDGDEAAPAPGEATPTGDKGPTKACVDSIFACAKPAETGENCAQVGACMAKCDSDNGEGGDGGFGCPAQCAAKGAKAEVEKFVTVMFCDQGCAKQCESSSEEGCKDKCIASTCGAEAAACFPK